MATGAGGVPGPGRIDTGSAFRVGLALFAFAIAFLHFDAVARTLLIGYAAAALAVALDTIVRRIPFERKWATGVVGLMLFALVGATVWYGGSLLIDQLRGLIDELPVIEQRVAEWVTLVRARTGLRLEGISTGITEALASIASGGGGIISRVQGLLGALALSLVVLFGALFALANPNKRLLDPLLRTIPLEHHESVRHALDLLAHRLVGWIQGKLLAMFAVGALSLILFSIIGVPYALLLAVFNGLIEFIPIIGPWIGGGVATIVAAVADPSKGAMTAAASVIIQLAENTLITPLAMQDRAKIHPFVTLIALILFGAVFGFLGVLLAIPLVLLIWTVVEVFWVDRRLHTAHGKIDPVVDE